MDVWMSVCRKRAKCKYCPGYIENGDYMVVGKVWRNREGEARRWAIKLHWHVDCWVEQGKRSLDLQPKPETRGRKKLAMSDDNKSKRVKILMRRAAILQRMKAATDEGNVDKLIYLGGLMNKLKEEIQEYGGIPASWT